MGHTTVHALDGIDLLIEKSRFLAVMGASGSGKSTLMNILGCLDTPSSGSYALDGREVGGLNDDELAYIRNRHIGFVFQSFNLLPRLSALKNVTLPLRYTREPDQSGRQKARELLAMVGLADRMDHHPRELSGGEMQRVAIARALVNDPDIVLADEPTGNLDSTTAKEIMRLLSNLHGRGHTVVMVTHEKDIAAYADRVVVLKDGKIVDDYEQN